MAADGKRRFPRDAPARWLLVLALACLSVVGGLIGASLLALITAFVAAVVVIDYVFPITGFLRVDAQHAFQRLVWQRRRETLRRRGSRGLLLLDGHLEQTAARRHRGIRPIPLDSIVGTVEPQKAAAFDHAFRPPAESRGRWELMWMVRRRGDSLPPISVYRRPAAARRRSIPWPRPWVLASVLPATGLGLTLLSGAFATVSGSVLILAACAVIGHGLGIPVQTGLEDYRQ